MAGQCVFDKLATENPFGNRAELLRERVSRPNQRGGSLNPFNNRAELLPNTAPVAIRRRQS